jgi:hypothetical protein
MIEKSRQFKAYLLTVGEGGVTATHKGEKVGHLNVIGGVVDDVAVEPKHQEKGLATAMLHFGREHMPIAHNIESNQTPSGRLWAKAVP